MGLAPAPMFPEKSPTAYEVNAVSGAPSGPGPLYFEEGLGTDTDIPSNFQYGAMQGYQTPPGRSNHNANVYINAFTITYTIPDRNPHANTYPLSNTGT